MRGSLLVSLSLACGAMLFSVGAHAVPIRVGLQAAGGSHSWTSGPIEDPSFVTLSAWQLSGDFWSPAYMTNWPDSHGNPGLGVCGDQLGTNDECSSTDETNEIDSLPQQMIEMDISEFENWNGLTITLLSVEQSPFPGLMGASCSLLDSDCTPTPISLFPSCTGPDSNGIVLCTYTKAYLTDLGINAIWIRPQAYCIDFRDGRCFSPDFLLGSGLEHGLILDLNPESVPEPSVLGIFGLGTLLIGLFVGLRRRRMA